jgi:hypothetical protein
MYLGHSLQDYVGYGDNILITQKWGVIKVGVAVNEKNEFHGTISIICHFNKLEFLAPDSIRKMPGFNQFGQEWYVLESEPINFNERHALQQPEKCTLSTAVTKRRLGEDPALHQMAEKAFAGAEEA